jgi:hypothetical protein
MRASAEKQLASAACHYVRGPKKAGGVFAG